MGRRVWPNGGGYPTDLSDVGWAVLEPLVPPAMPGERPRKHPRRGLIDALAYWVRAGGYSLGCGAPGFTHAMAESSRHGQTEDAVIRRPPRVGVGHVGGRNGCVCFYC